MGNGKTPGNDGITKEFYVKFWDFLKELKNYFLLRFSLFWLVH